jgi:hypothetical protein
VSPGVDGGALRQLAGSSPVERCHGVPQHGRRAAKQIIYSTSRVPETIPDLDLRKPDPLPDAYEPLLGRELFERGAKHLEFA